MTGRSAAFFLFFFWNAAVCVAQTRPADSLKLRLKNAPLHERAKLMNGLSEIYRTIHFDSSLYYAENALKYSRKHKQTAQEHAALIQLSTLSYSKGLYDTALNQLSFLQSKEIIENYNLFKANNVKGLILLRKGESQGALDAFYQSLRYAEKEPDPALRFRPLLNIGLTFMELGQYDKAVLRFREIKDRAKPGDIKLLSVTCGNMAACFGSLNEVDSVKTYALLALNYSKMLGDAQASANALNILSNYYLEKGQFDSAAIALVMAQPYRKNLKDPYFEIADLLSLALVYSKQNKHLEAKKTILQAKRITDSTHMAMKFENLYLLLAQTEQKLGNHKEAANYFYLWGSQKDSLYSKASEEALADLQVRYDIARHEKDNLALRNRQQETERDNALKKAWILGLAGSLVALILLFVVVNMRRKNRQRVLRQKEEQRQEMLRFRAMVEGESKERERLAKELHDGLGQLLVTSKMSIDSIHEQSKQSKQATEMLNEAIGELRNISHNLMPATLSRLGLLAALRDMRNRIETSHIQCPWILPETLSLSREEEHGILRIIQEVVNNMLKHARATTIELRMETKADRLEIRLRDDGVGFDPATIQNTPGMGWDNIRFRVRLFEGEFALNSSPGSGTLINIYLPSRPEAVSLETRTQQP